MKYQNEVTQDILTYDQLKAANPSASLAPSGTDPISIPDGLDPIGYEVWRWIQPTTRPAHDPYTQAVTEIAPVAYVQTWQIVALSPLEIAEHIASAKVSKYRETELLAEDLVDEANADPFVGSNTTAPKNKRKVNARMNHATNGNPKSDLDKDRDDELADYTDSVADAQDSADDVIEDGNDAQAIYALDVATIVTWPTWNPPA